MFAHLGARSRAHLLGDLLRVLAHAALDIELGLGDEVDRAELERAQRDLRARVGQRRDHDDRHRPQAHELFEKAQAVHLRHLDVERNDVGIERADHLACGERIGRGADHFQVRLCR